MSARETELYTCNESPLVNKSECCTCSQSSSSVISFSTTQSSIQISSTQDDSSVREPASFHEDALNSRNAEMHELEQRLDAMMQERVEQALNLQRLRDGFNEQAPVFGLNGFTPAISALEFIGIAYWAFFVLRFVCVSDLNLLICLLGSVSLICLTFAFATEQHLFFWPFAFVCLLEILVAGVQFTSISLLVYRSHGKLGRFMNSLLDHEELFSNALLDEMQTWKGITLVMLYFFGKLVVFSLAFVACVQVARIFYDKDDVLRAQETNMDFHHQQMAVIIHRLEMLRRANTPPVVEATPQAIAPPPARPAFISTSLPNLSLHGPNARSQLSAIRSITS